MSPHRKLTLPGALACTLLALITARPAAADERFFTYAYEPDVLLKGKFEIEQWLTGRFGREGGTYQFYDLRTELEYGLTQRLTTSLYLNLEGSHISVADESQNEFKYDGVSSEWKLQLTSPYSSPLGSLLYFELAVRPDEVELEEKLVLGKHGQSWDAVFNAVFEQSWEDAESEASASALDQVSDVPREKHAALEFDAGFSWKLSPHWAIGIEGRNNRTYTDGFDLAHQESSAWFLGPALHYGGASWWSTLTVLPQLHGDSDVVVDGLDLADHERIEVRWLAGFLL